MHPCDLGDNGGCQHVCSKKGSDVLCSCEEGFELGDDEKTCVKRKNGIQYNAFIVD